MAKPGELPSPLPPDYLGSQVFMPIWAVVRLGESAYRPRQARRTRALRRCQTRVLYRALWRLRFD